MGQEVCHCRNCHAELFLFFVKADNSQKYKVSSNCPYCGDKSFKPLVNGHAIDEKKLKIVNVESKQNNELWLELAITTTTGK